MKILTIEDFIKDIGEIPICRCDECQKTGIKVNIKLNRRYYNGYKRSGYPKFLPGHQSRGLNHPLLNKHHSKEAKKNMSIAQKEQYKLHPERILNGDKNPMFGKTKELNPFF